MITDFLSFLYDFGRSLFLTTDMIYYLVVNPLSNVFGKIADTWFAGINVFALLLPTGFVVYLGVLFVKWVIGIVT